MESLAPDPLGRDDRAPRPRRSSSAILESRPHPEQGYRSCLGLLRLAKRHWPGAAECRLRPRARAGARSYRHVDVILKHGLDRLPLDGAPAPPGRAGPCTTTSAAPRTTTAMPKETAMHD